MLSGTLLVEGLRVGSELRVPDLRLLSAVRRDVSGPDGATGDQPAVWTFVYFEAPDERVDELANALAAALEPTNGWYADFVVGNEHVVVFAGRVFRYHRGDASGRAAAVEHGLAAGTPPHQLDWAD